jgi:ribose-phosphate pyrophosphokinase
MRGELLILSTRSMAGYAARVADHVRHNAAQVPSLDPDGQAGDLRCVRFADGEMEVEIRSSLRGKDVFLFAGCGRNATGLSVEENKLELYHAIDAIKRSDAGRITLFEPYLSASRSDRTTRRNSVGFWVHYKILMSLGVNHIITFQLHSDKSKTAVDPTLCAIDDVPANPLVAQYIADSFVACRDCLDREVREQWLFCSVDAGGEKLAKRYAQGFGTRLVIAHKQRDYHRQNSVESITLLTDTTLEGKNIWIVDDMIDTGGSVMALLRELRSRGVARINVAVIHPVFSPPAVTRLRELHAEGSLERLVCTDTIELTQEVRDALPFLHVVSSARLAAEIVMKVHLQQSLSPYFEDFSADRHFTEDRLL